jgi:hypothetical protein
LLRSTLDGSSKSTLPLEASRADLASFTPGRQLLETQCNLAFDTTRCPFSGEAMQPGDHCSYATPAIGRNTSVWICEPSYKTKVMLASSVILSRHSSLTPLALQAGQVVLVYLTLGIKVTQVGTFLTRGRLSVDHSRQQLPRQLTDSFRTWSGQRPSSLET